MSARWPMSDARSFTMLAPMTDDGVHGGSLRLLVVDGVSGPNDSFVLPTGTVTFLLTDVEGSTTGWEAAPSGMAEAIPRHYALLDEAIAAHGGVRPVEQGEGDSVVGAFSRASDAVAAAVGAQRALAEEPWPDGVRLRVRMAIHTGEAQLRDEGNYFGQAVIRCARLRAIGHGGQVLVSEATAALVADRLPEQVGLLDLGTHRLKDLGRPEHVWQLVHPDLTARVSAAALAGRVPPQPAGPAHAAHRPGPRDRARSSIDWPRPAGHAHRLGRRRQDPPGPGRRGRGGGPLPRRRVVGRAGRGDGPRDVAATALAALGVHEMRGVDPIEHLAAALGDEASLVVLDNCEHLVARLRRVRGGPARLAGPSVSVLATSREPLGVPGEITWRVPSLPCPAARSLAGRADAVAVRRRGAVRRPGTAGPTLVRGRPTPTRRPSPRSAIASTASRWRSSWPRPAAGSCPPNASPPSSTTASGC